MKELSGKQFGNYKVTYEERQMNLSETELVLNCPELVLELVLNLLNWPVSL